MTEKVEELKITVICCNPECDRKFSFLLSTIKKKRVVYLGVDDEKLGSKLIWPKIYVVPCPYCGAENEVTLP
jgi:hypothetical protein